MAAGNSNLSSTSVLLRDRTVPNTDGSGLVLHPETELTALVMTTGGGIVSSGNSLYLDPSSAWDSGLDDIVAGSYCPLEKTITSGGSTFTQYADMFTSGGTATQINLDGSTGYGTLVNVISTITSVRSVDSANNSGVPTELAVAVALAGKENIVSGGSCVYINREATSTTIGVSATTTIRAVASAVDTMVPTEKAVAYALDVALNTASGYADNVYTTIINKNYATQSYVNEAIAGATFSLQPATATTLGGVIVPADKGLTIDTNGKLSVTLGASYATYNATQGMNAAGVLALSAITSVSDAAYLNYAYVPTVQAVWNFVSSYVATNLPAAGLCIGITATTPARGGVRVVTGGGITVTTNGTSAGNIYLTGATIFGTYNAAASGTYFGGVKVTSVVEAAGDGQEAAIPVVPTTDAVYNYVAAAISGITPAAGGDFAVTETVDTDVPDGHKYTIAAGSVYLDGMSTVFKTVATYDYSNSGDTPWELWARIPYAGTVYYDNSPVFNGTTTSVPIAYIIGSTVYQHQHGPIVIRGRWA